MNTTSTQDICEAISQSCSFDVGAADNAEYDDSGFADDTTWVLTSSFVILTMQSGFGMLEMGSVSTGNEVNIMIKNVFDVVFGGLAYFFLGYGISFGTPSNGFMGLGDFTPGNSNVRYDDTDAFIQDALIAARYLFQFSFAATSTTIVSGCVAMRMKFFVYCFYAFYAVIIYSFVAHWVWDDNGFLSKMGVHDFAGSGPVHLFGAWNGLIAILMIGPRTGRFNSHNRRPESDFAGTSPTSMLFGLFMLWWGWIGFNCGSSFGITGNKWILATRAGVTTIIATCGGGIGALLYTQVRSKGKCVRPAHIVNGILGSLVSITATCASVHTYDSLAIGFFGGIIALLVNDFVEFRLKLDDPVGAIGVHGASGVFGILSVGLFADDRIPEISLISSGLFRGGGFRLLGVQCLEIVAILIWSTLCITPFFYLLGVLLSKKWKDPRSGLRVPLEEELSGADEYLHGCSENVRTLIETMLKRNGYVRQQGTRNIQVEINDLGNCSIVNNDPPISESDESLSKDPLDLTSETEIRCDFGSSGNFKEDFNTEEVKI